MEAHEGHFAELLEEAQSHIDYLIKETYVAPKNAMEHWAGGVHFIVPSLTPPAFSSAIDWTETWIRGLLCFHVLLFLIVIISRKNVDLQTFFFFFIAILVFLSETINTFCSSHWKEFSRQNYFDKNGIFVGILFSAPLLCICLFQLVRTRSLLFCVHFLAHLSFQLNFLSLASSSLITFKKLEHKKKTAEKEEKEKTSRVAAKGTEKID
jgi:transmembrane protein 18